MKKSTKRTELNLVTIAEIYNKLESKVSIEPLLNLKDNKAELNCLGRLYQFENFTNVSEEINCESNILSEVPKLFNTPDISIKNNSIQISEGKKIVKSYKTDLKRERVIDSNNNGIINKRELYITKDIFSILNNASIYTSEDWLKPNMQSIHIINNTVYSSEGFRIYFKEINQKIEKIEINKKQFEIIKFLYSFNPDVLIFNQSDIKPNKDENYSINTYNWITFMKGNQYIYIYDISTINNPPNFSYIIPENKKYKIECNYLKDFKNCIEESLLFSNKTTKEILLIANEGNLIVQSQDIDFNKEYQNELICNNNELFSFALNGKYLLEYLKTLDLKTKLQIIIEGNAYDKPILINNEFLIMPVLSSTAQEINNGILKIK